MRHLLSIALVLGSASAFGQDPLITVTSPDSSSTFGTYMNAKDGVLYVGGNNSRVHTYDWDTLEHLDTWAHTSQSFGAAIEVYDGKVFVGAPLHLVNGTFGAVEVYDLAGNHLSSILSPFGNGFIPNYFGECLAADHGLLVVGAHDQEVNSESQVGSVAIYDASTLALLGLFTPTDTTLHQVGHSVEILGPNDIVVGSSGSGAWRIDATGAITQTLSFSTTGLVCGRDSTLGNGYLVFSERNSNGATVVFDAATCTELYALPRAGSISIDEDNDVLALNKSSLQLFVHDLATGTEVQAITSPGGWSNGQGSFAYRGRLAFHLITFGPTTGHLAIYALGQAMGTEYCTSPANSTGLPGRLEIVGSIDAADNWFNLTMLDVPPGEFAMFLNSPAQGFVANPAGSDGNLCLGGGIGRHTKTAAALGATGFLSQQVDLTALPRPTGQPPQIAVMPGDTFHFQGWHRDGASSNFTNAKAVTFQ